VIEVISKFAKGGKLWTANETAMVDAAIAAGLRAIQCMAMFPDRGEDGVLQKFIQRRKALGVPGRPGHPFGPCKEAQAQSAMPIEMPEPFESPAEVASRKLIEATLDMYVNKASREQCTLEEAMLRALYAPAQVDAYQRMAA
jgi:hypothetical protein